MISKIYVAIYFVFMTSCSSWAIKKHTLTKEFKDEGYYEVGECVQDSIFHGVVNMYDYNKNVIGFSTYYFGVRNGLYVNKYKNGVTKDSIWMRFDKKNGMASSFDSLGRIISRNNYINDRPVGDQYIFDTLGKIVQYDFLSFEGKSLYETEFRGDSIFGSGKLINYILDTISTPGGQDSIKFFAYLIRPVEDTLQYAFSKMNGERIVSKVEIPSNKVIYEATLAILPKGYYYALTVLRYNSFKKRNDMANYFIH